MIQRDSRNLALIGPYIIKRIKDNISDFINHFTKDLEALFLYGMECKFNYPTCKINNFLPYSETINFRAILMFMTGDHSVQCKLSNLKSSGKIVCRKCKMHSELVDDQHIYGQNEVQCVHPPER